MRTCPLYCPPAAYPCTTACSYAAVSLANAPWHWCTDNLPVALQPHAPTSVTCFSSCHVCDMLHCDAAGHVPLPVLWSSCCPHEGSTFAIDGSNILCFQWQHFVSYFQQFVFIITIFERQCWTCLIEVLNWLRKMLSNTFNLSSFRTNWAKVDFKIGRKHCRWPPLVHAIDTCDDQQVAWLRSH